MSIFDPTLFEPVIGLEIHAQLQTQSKIFASDPVLFGQEPNTLISPITLGHPGTLPKLNKQVVNYAIKMGLAIGSSISQKQYFDRKNYFYPDLPKGYQITQDKTPICMGGTVTVHLKAGTKQIPFHHIHLEEDAGKSIHEGDNPFSFIDYNRAGTALIEMVTEPAIHSAEEAFALVTEVRKLVRYLGICDGNMEEGSLRADVNISLRKVGETKLGTKVEIKNMNSIRNIQRAIEYECVRQQEALLNGESLIQETRTFDAHTGKTHSMRIKETMNDYRYFPEPDLAPLAISNEWIEEIKNQMPLLPWEQEKEFTDTYQLPAYDAHFLAESKEMADYFKEVASFSKAYKSISNWLMGPVKTYLNDNHLEIQQYPLTAKKLAEIIDLVEAGTLSHNLAVHQLLPLCLADTGQSVHQIIDKQGWLENKPDEDSLQKHVEETLSAFPEKVKEFHQGKKGLIAMFIGDVMKKTKGTADPKRLNQLMAEALENRK